jgi:hypothetical protein
MVPFEFLRVLSTVFGESQEWTFTPSLIAKTSNEVVDERS